MENSSDMQLQKEMKRYYNISDSYLEHLKEEQESEKFNWKGYVKFATRYIKDGDKVLELGSGIGTAAIILKRIKKIDLTATDISGKFIKFAKKKKAGSQVHFEVQDSARLTYKDNTFDVVTSMGMLEHTLNPKSSIDEMLRVLKRNGRLIIVFPNWFSWFKILKTLLNFRKREYFENNRPEMLVWLFKSFYYFIQKRISPKPIFRKPNLKLKVDKLKYYHNDEDMTYIAHPLDVKHYLLKKGCKVEKIAADTFRFSFIPTLAPYGGIVAIKKI